MGNQINAGVSRKCPDRDAISGESGLEDGEQCASFVKFQNKTAIVLESLRFLRQSELLQTSASRPIPKTHRCNIVSNVPVQVYRN